MRTNNISLSETSEQRLAHLLQIDSSNIVEVLRNRLAYVTFSVPKKHGGHRIIEAPQPPLKQIQTAIHKYLLDKMTFSDSVHGFVLRKNILSNANVHIGRNYVFNLDLQNFFPSISDHQVYEEFWRFPFGGEPVLCELLTRLCTFKGHLPQGAPTSPIISNMVCRNLDNELEEFTDSVEMRYSRYADDITLSSYQLPPSQVVTFERKIPRVGAGLRCIIEENGFRVNDKKVRLQPKYRRQEVTGIIVNTRPNVPREYLNQIRAMLHSLKLDGETGAAIKHFRNQPNLDLEALPSFTAILRGKIDYVGFVRGREDRIYLRLLDDFIACAN